MKKYIKRVASIFFFLLVTSIQCHAMQQEIGTDSIEKVMCTNYGNGFKGIKINASRSISSNLPDPWYNQIYLDDIKDLEPCLQHVRDNPYVLWIKETNKTLLTDLETLGYKHLHHLTYMECALRTLEAPEQRDCIAVEEINPNSKLLLTQWIAIHTLAAKGDYSKEESFIEHILKIGKKENFHLCIIKKNNISTGVGYFMSYPDKSISLHSIAVIPAYRKQGFATRLVHCMLHKAKLLGYNKAILASSDAGKKLYKKLGFKECCEYKVLTQQNQ